MAGDPSNYTYNGQCWRPSSTVSDHNSFFHSAFGVKTDEHEAYFDKDTKLRRMRWSAFLTYFENKSMPSCLTDLLKKCLCVPQECTLEDKALFAKYVSDITTAEQSITIEEIPVLSVVENVTVVVFTDISDSVIIIKPNTDILGGYNHVPETPREVVLCLKGNTFSRLNATDEDSEVKSQQVNDMTTEKNDTNAEISNLSNTHPTKYGKGGCAGIKGVEFQVYLLTVFLLNALQYLTNWRLSTENKQAGKFDDVVLESPDKGVVLLQAKYKEKKQVTFDQLLSTNSKNDDFSLPKYFFSYQEIKRKFQVKIVIICTNTNVCSKSLKFLHRQNVYSESMLHYGDGCSFFVFDDEILPHLKENVTTYYKNNLQSKGIDEGIITEENMKDFLKNLQFYSNYPPGNNLKNIVEKLLFRMKYSNSLCCKTSSQDIYNKVKDWFQQPAGEYLTEDRAKSIFCEIRSEKFCETLEQYNITLERNDFDFTNTNRIYLISAESGYVLPAIKTYSALRNNKTKMLYVNPDDSTDVQKQIIQSFGLPSYTCLIIIWCKITDESLREELFSEISGILERYKYKKLIVISDNCEAVASQITSDEDSYSIIEKPVHFKDLSINSQRKLLKKNNILFQGRNFSLEELISEESSENHDSLSLVDTEILEKLVLDEKIKVGTEVQLLDDNVARYYIDREFKRKGKTRGEEILSVEKIYEVNEKVIIVADTAGMGKSTVLTKLAGYIKNKDPHLWVIRIELNDYSGILKEFLRKNRKTMNVMELLDYKEATKITNEFEKFIFSMKGKVVLMLDGVDEISPDYAGLIINLISQCQEASNFAKIFVTTRPHMTEELEANFHVKPFILQSLTSQNQIDFLTNYWMLNLELTETNKAKCQQYASALIKKMRNWIKPYHHRERQFTAIPLQVRMLAEIFQDNNQLEGLANWEGCKEFLSSQEAEPKLPEKLNITKLYEIFIEKKRDVFIDKGNPSGTVAANHAFIDQFDECLVYHRTLAVKVILDETKYNMFTQHEQGGRNVILNMLKIGIVQKLNNKLYFVHRTFAEYFVAESLLRELIHNETVEFQRFLIEEVFSQPQYNVIRAFFDNCLQNTIDFLPSDIFQNYQSFTYETDLCKKRKFTLIHQLAEEGCGSIIQLLLKCIYFKIVTDTETSIVDQCDFDSQNQTKILSNNLNILQSLIQQYGINIKDESGRTPLHYAAENGYLELVKFLISEGADVDSRDSADFVPLREAVRGGHFDTAKYLIENRAEVNVKDRLGHCILYDAIIENRVNIVKYIMESISKNTVAATTDFMTAYTAAYLGDLDTLNALLKKGVDVNSKADNEETFIFGATRGGQLNTIQFLLQHGANIDSKDDDGNTALWLAASKGQLDVVKYLTENGANVNVTDNEGRTALHTAASWGRIEIVKFLVDCGADVNHRDNDGYTALFLAAEEGLLDIIKFLVKHGANVNIRGYNQRTALFLAAMEGELDTVKYLVKRGANINLKDSEGCTALFLAAEENELETVKYLVQCGANINIRNSDGHTALHLSLLPLRQLDKTKFLVECGADVNIRDNDGRTPLFLAVKEGQMNAVKFLVNAEADINIRDKNGCTALHLATLRRHLNVVKFLVECGIEVNTEDCNGWTALHLATFWGQLDTIKFLIEHGADVKIRAGGHTVLFLAAREGRLDIVKFFILELDMVVDNRDKRGCTALHYAASNGHTGVVKFLIEQGANINSRDNYGNTPANSARRKGHLHLLRYLEAEELDSKLSFLCCNYFFDESSAESSNC